MTVAGQIASLKRLSPSITDTNLQNVIRNLENKLIEIDARLTDLERRVKAGGL